MALSVKMQLGSLKPVYTSSSHMRTTRNCKAMLLTILLKEHIRPRTNWQDRQIEPKLVNSELKP